MSLWLNIMYSHLCLLQLLVSSNINPYKLCNSVQFQLSLMNKFGIQMGSLYMFHLITNILYCMFSKLQRCYMWHRVMHTTHKLVNLRHWLKVDMWRRKLSKQLLNKLSNWLVLWNMASKLDFQKLVSTRKIHLNKLYMLKMMCNLCINSSMMCMYLIMITKLLVLLMQLESKNILLSKWYKCMLMGKPNNY